MTGFCPLVKERSSLNRRCLFSPRVSFTPYMVVRNSAICRPPLRYLFFIFYTEQKDPAHALNSCFEGSNKTLCQLLRRIKKTNTQRSCVLPQACAFIIKRESNNHYQRSAPCHSVFHWPCYASNDKSTKV